MKWLLFAVALCGFQAWAADISGVWKGSAETPNGTVERTFVFKVEGARLTGETTSNIFGKSAIEDGKIDGDNVSFTITVKMQDNEAKANYKGKVAGDQIKFTVELPSFGSSIEYTVKRVP